MGMVEACSFDGMVTADLDERFDVVGSVTTIGSANGRHSSNALRLANFGGQIRRLNLANHATYGVAFSCKLASLPGSAQPIFGFLDSTTLQIDLAVNETGHVLVRRSGSTTLGTSAAAVIFAGSEHHIQFMVVINDATGTYEVKVDGVSVLSGTGADTKNTANAYANGYDIGNGGASGSSIDIDDLYVWNGAGSLNTGFPGDVKVFASLPSGAGNSAQWTPSTGSNYQCVDESSPNAATDYVSETTVNEKDTYAFADIAGSGTVLGAQVSVYAQKSDAGAVRGIKAVCRSGSTEADSAEAILSTSWRYALQVPFETDPATSAAWASLAALNAAEWGVKLTT